MSFARDRCAGVGSFARVFAAGLVALALAPGALARAVEASEAAGADERAAHRHFDGCGHWWDGARWLSFPPEHAHGEGCGHYWYDGDWHRFPREHVHGPRCGHFFH